MAGAIATLRLKVYLVGVVSDSFDIFEELKKRCFLWSIVLAS
jgi:hypothetical protein